MSGTNGAVETMDVNDVSLMKSSTLNRKQSNKPISTGKKNIW
jgi:hypothetical protein